MLFSGYQESQPKSGPWQVKLPEDDTDSAEVLLNIAHTRFQHVPDSPGVELLYGVLIFADKYDMTRTVAPWVKRWTSLLSKTPRLSPCKAYLAFGIACELGDENLLVRLCNHLVFHSEIDDEGRLVDSKWGGFPGRGKHAVDRPGRTGIG